VHVTVQMYRICGRVYVRVYYMLQHNLCCRGNIVDTQLCVAVVV